MKHYTPDEMFYIFRKYKLAGSGGGLPLQVNGEVQPLPAQQG